MAWTCPLNGLNFQNSPKMDPTGGKREKGNPKATWQRTMTSELKTANLSWGEAQHTAGQDQMEADTRSLMGPTRIM